MISLSKSMVTIVTMLFFFCSFKISAQTNLITNPSFEVQPPYPNCAGGNVGALEILFPGILKWTDPLEGFGAGSTDHFHTCRLPGDIFSAPGPNKFGYQQPRTGNAYIAVQTYWKLY
jgi:hypothetical protein